MTWIQSVWRSHSTNYLQICPKWSMLICSLSVLIQRGLGGCLHNLFTMYLQKLTFQTIVIKVIMNYFSTLFQYFLLYSIIIPRFMEIFLLKLFGIFRLHLNSLKITMHTSSQFTFRTRECDFVYKWCVQHDKLANFRHLLFPGGRRQILGFGI